MGRHLRIGAARFPYPENRVVATPLAPGLTQDGSMADTPSLQARLALGIGQGHGADEAATAIGGISQFAQQAGDALGIRGGIPG